MEASTNRASHMFPRDAIQDQYDICIDPTLGNCPHSCWWAKLWRWFWNQLEVMTRLMPQYQTPERGVQTFLSPFGSRDRNTTIGKTERWAGGAKARMCCYPGRGWRILGNTYVFLCTLKFHTADSLWTGRATSAHRTIHNFSNREVERQDVCQKHNNEHTFWSVMYQER